MKAWAIAWKDLRSSLRSAFLIVMMFVAPLMLTGIFYVAFGRGDSSSITISTVKAVVANLDAGAGQYGGFSVGDTLLDLLKGSDLSQLLALTEVADEAVARADVDAGRADLAIILPADLTRAVYAPGSNSAVTVYHDPALTVGPSLVRGIVTGYVDGFAGVKIAAQVLRSQFAEAGLPVDERLELRAMQQYASWASGLSQQTEAGAAGFQVTTPSRAAGQGGSTASMLAITLIGMSIFFVFFTGASTAETLIREDEEHTLARMYTTPTPYSTILGGKLLSVGLTVAMQLVVLMAAGRLVFGIRWGMPLAVLLMSVSLVAAASGYGVLVISFVRSTRQSGAVMGGVMTLTGMLGGLMTVGIQNLPAGFRTVNLLTPHGWALRGWTQVLGGAGLGATWPWALGCAAWGVVTFAVGVARFRKRFA